MGEALRRRMGAVRRRERIVDIEVAERREFLHEGRIVLLLAGVKAGVFEEQDVAVRRARPRLSPRRRRCNLRRTPRLFRDAVASASATGRRTLLQIAPFGTAEMRQKDHLPAFVGNLVERRQHALDAGRIGDPAVFHRNVEIDANEHALSLDVGLVQRAESFHLRPRQISFAMATAVSAMRFEKPHSLSYHASTRTRVPSSTLVWSMWKVDEAGSWLKSIETFGSCV